MAAESGAIATAYRLHRKKSKEIAMTKSAITALCLCLAAGAAAIAQGAPSPQTAKADQAEQAAPTAISESDRLAIRTLVESQLKALAADDGERAFSFAAPEIKKQFGDAATFMTMVKRGYPMLIRPSGVSFLEPEKDGDLITQAVRFRDPNGKLWRAVYALQRQPDNSWRIGGCVVRQDRQSLAT